MLHLPIQSQTDEARERVRREALSSTYVMANLIGFHDITNDLHLKMANWIDSGDGRGGAGRRKSGTVPRDHLKSSLWTIANSTRRIAKDPNIRILVASDTATNAQHMLRRIEAVFERCALFKWAFSEIVPDFTKVKKWSETEMLVPRSMDFMESTVESIGVGGAAASRHFNIIKCDDLVTKAASESPDVMKDTIDWYQYLESLLDDPKDEIHVVGTPWAYRDLIHWMLKNEKEYLDVFMTGCYHPDGRAIWPERFPVEELERIRKKMGSFKFSCQYLCKPCDPEQTSFLESWLRYWRWNRNMIEAGPGPLIPLSSLRIFMRIDPAISEAPGACRSAIVVDGVHSDGRKFLLEDWAKRCQPFEMLDQMFKFQEQYDCVSVGVEAVAYQRILKPLIEVECARRGIWINVVELKPDTREKKDNRIRGAQPELERGMIWIREDHVNFLGEYREFPSGDTKDVLDAWAYGPHQWSTPDEEGDEDDEGESLFRRDVMLDGRSEYTGY